MNKKKVAADLKAIYGADTLEMAEANYGISMRCGAISTHIWLSLGALTEKA